MKKRVVVSILSMFCVISFTAEASFKIVGYVPNWGNLYTFADNLDYSRVTHLNIAFKNPNSSGDLSAMSAGENYLVSKAHANGVQILMSIGGAGAGDCTDDDYNGDMVVNDEDLSLLSSKLKQYIVANNLDGLDIDLEGSSIGDNYGAFIQILSDSIKPIGKLLTSALSQGYGGAAVPNSTFTYFDWINIMAYDACGPTWGSPGQHSPYSMAVTALDYWKGRGLPKAKAILGVPFYGYEFGPSSPSMSGVLYKNIIASYPDYATEDMVQKSNGNKIYYNGIYTIIDKTSLALAEGGGIMIWELASDGTGNNSLLKYIRQVAGSAVTTAVEEYAKEEKGSVYPNPSTGVLNLKGFETDELRIELYSATGVKIQKDMEGTVIDLSDEPKGVYYLHVINKEKVTVRKVVIQ